MCTTMVSDELLTWGVVCGLSGGLCPCVLPWRVRGIADLGISLCVALVAACARVFYHGE